VNKRENVKHLGILAILLLLPCVIGGLRTSPGSATGLLSGRQVVTLAEYEQLWNGMSYVLARSIIGEPGEELSRVHFDGAQGVMEPVDTVMYSWRNGDGSNMNAMFQNDRLIQKAQFGLK
jgi:hypothetical protein